MLSRHGLSRGSSLAVVRAGGQLLLVGVTETSVSVLRELEEEPEHGRTRPQDPLPAGPVAGPAGSRSGRWWSCCASGPPVVADLRRAALAALLLAPLFVLLLGAPSAQAAPATTRVGQVAVAAPRPGRRWDGAEPDADHDLHRRRPPPGRRTSSGNVSVNLDPGVGKPSQTVSIILLLTVLSVAPALLVLCTSFTKMIVVLSLTRNALGTPTIPPNQVLAGLALFLSLFIMAPVLSQMNDQALQPYLKGDDQPVPGLRRRREAAADVHAQADPQGRARHDDPAEQDRRARPSPRTCR